MRVITSHGLGLVQTRGVTSHNGGGGLCILTTGGSFTPTDLGDIAFKITSFFVLYRLRLRLSLILHHIFPSAPLPSKKKKKSKENGSALHYFTESNFYPIG